MLEGISAITLATHDMARAVAFYEELGFALKFGGPGAEFRSGASRTSHALRGDQVYKTSFSKR